MVLLGFSSPADHKSILLLLISFTSSGLYLMEENKQSQSGDKKKEDPKPEEKVVVGGGWGGWGLARFSVLSDLQKATTLAAEELSRNAVEVAKNAAKSIGDMQNTVLDS